MREARKFNRELYVKIVVPLANRATMIKPGDEVVPGIRAVDAFGHSPGLMAFTIESEGKRMINWADTCNHYVVSLQRPDLHLDVDDDKEKAVATRKRILDMVANEDLLVAGFHMPFPGLGYVEKAQKRLPLGAARLSDEFVMVRPAFTAFAGRAPAGKRFIVRPTEIRAAAVSKPRLVRRRREILTSLVCEVLLSIKT